MNAQTKANYKGLFDAFKQGVWVLNQAGCTTYVNPFLATLLGYDASEMLAQSIYNFLDEPSQKAYRQCLEQNDDAQAFSFYCKSGSIIFARVQMSPTYDEKGQHTGTLNIISETNQDLLQILKKDKDLSYTKRMLEHTSQMARVGGWTLDIKTQTLSWSAMTKEIHEVSPHYQPTLDKGIEFYKEGESRDTITHVVNQAMTSGTPYDVELQIITATGKERWVRAIGQAQMSNGYCVKLMGTFQDIHDWKQTQFDNDRFRAIMDCASEAIFFIDPHQGGRFIDVNKTACVSLGYSKKELLAMQVADISGDADFPVHFLDATPDSVYQFTSMHRRKDHSCFPVSLSITQDNFGGEDYILAVARDTTRTEKMAMDLKHSEERWQLALQAVGDGMWDWNLVDNTVYYSPRWEEIVGFAPGAAPRELDTFSEHVHPDDLASVFAKVNQYLAKQTPEYNMEFRMLRVDGSELWTLHRGQALFDSSGKATRMIGTVVDLTVQYQAKRELQAAKQSAEEANTAKSTFLSRMSHEFRTPLNAIMGFSRLLANRVPKENLGNHMHYPMKIYNAGDHLLNLVNDVLDVVNIEQGKLAIELEFCHLLSICDTALAACEADINAHSLVVTKEGLDNVVLADSQRLTQVLTNLISNACKYNRPNGTVKVSAATVDNDIIEVSVEDTGIGILPKEQAKIFEPFTRLHYAEWEEISGVGIGLTLAQYLVFEMGSILQIDSTEGQGSRFHFCLSKTQTSSMKHPENVRIPLAKIPIKRNLVHYVEDNEDSRELLKEACRELPTVYLKTFTNAEECITTLETERPDIILMDINLPGMSGIEATDFIKGNAALRDISIVALSADALPQQIGQAMEHGFDQYLTKPVNIHQLAELLKTSGDTPGR